MSSEEKAPKQPSGNSRKLVQGSLATTGVLLALGIAIMANLIASQLFWRVDMTEGKVYTLSEPSRELVSSIEEPVRVKVFLSQDMPPPFHTLHQRVSDLLTEYEAASGGKLTFEMITPSDSDGADSSPEAGVSEDISDTAGYGCKKVAIGQETRDQVNIRAVFKCVAFIQGSKQQVLKDLRVTGNPERDNLEYHFTKALLNLDTTRTRKVGFLSGFGGPADMPNFIDTLEQPFDALYGSLIEPADVTLDRDNLSVPSDVAVVVILDPSEPISPEAKFALDQFLQRGGSIGWYQGATVPDGMMQQAIAKEIGPGKPIPDMRRAPEHGLDDLFATYGVVHQKDMIIDAQNAMTIRAMTAQGPAPVSFAPIFQINDMDRALPFLANSPPVIMPTPSSLVITEAATSSPNIQVYEALRTSSAATRLSPLPTQRSFETLARLGQGVEPDAYLVGVALQGTFPSYFENNPLPQGVSEDALYKGERVPGRIVVIGSGDFFDLIPSIGYDDRMAGIGQQVLFGSIEWMAQDNALSKIREKRLPRYIGEIHADDQRRIQFINIVFVPTCFALIGTIMMYRRRKRRERLSA